MLFEVLVLGGLGAMIVFLVRVEKILQRVLSIYERQIFEATVRDNMPTLWRDPKLSHENLAVWFDIANGPFSHSLREKWHWSALKDNFAKECVPGIVESAPGEIEHLKNLSSKFFDEAESSNLLTDWEIQYLLFYAWNSHLVVPGVRNPVIEFEGELSGMRQRFFTQKRSP
jgi:hypothetical protein